MYDHLTTEQLKADLKSYGHAYDMDEISTASWKQLRGKIQAELDRRNNSQLKHELKALELERNGK